MPCISLLLEQWRHCTKLMQLFCFTSCYAHVLLIPSTSSLLMSRRTGRKRNSGLAPLSLSFFVFLSPSCHLLVRSPSWPWLPSWLIRRLSCENADVCTEAAGPGSAQSCRPSEAQELWSTEPRLSPSLSLLIFCHWKSGIIVSMMEHLLYWTHTT